MTKKSCHNIIKYSLLALPVILLLLSLISYNSQYELVRDELEIFGNYFLNVPANAFYLEIVDLLGVSTLLDTPLGVVILIMPLYIMWVYFFDLVVDVLTFIPKAIHKLVEKVGGKYD